jgi:hypothetical protein
VHKLHGVGEVLPDNMQQVQTRADLRRELVELATHHKKIRTALVHLE